jgi:hypothetical protein
VAHFRAFFPLKIRAFFFSLPPPLMLLFARCGSGIRPLRIEQQMKLRFEPVRLDQSVGENTCDGHLKRRQQTGARDRLPTQRVLSEQ